MWADTLLAAERAHLVRLLFWAVASILVGSILLMVLAYRRSSAPLLQHFGIQTLAWGVVDLAIVWWARHGLALRDFDAAVGLEHFLWLNVGLDLGYVVVGVTLALAGWVIGRRMGAVGAGLGVVTQGLALLVLDAVILAHLGTMNIHG